MRCIHALTSTIGVSWNRASHQTSPNVADTTRSVLRGPDSIGCTRRAVSVDSAAHSWANAVRSRLATRWRRAASSSLLGSGDRSFDREEPEAAKVELPWATWHAAGSGADDHFSAQIRNGPSPCRSNDANHRYMRISHLRVSHIGDNSPCHPAMPTELTRSYRLRITAFLHRRVVSCSRHGRAWEVRSVQPSGMDTTWTLPPPRPERDEAPIFATPTGCHRVGADTVATPSLRYRPRVSSTVS